jgi:hypothetical protein
LGAKQEDADQANSKQGNDEECKLDGIVHIDDMNPVIVIGA